MAGNKLFICFSSRILSGIQARASHIWSYRPTHAPSVRGLVRVWGTHPGEMVTQAQHSSVTEDAAGAALDTDFSLPPWKTTAMNLFQLQFYELIVYRYVHFVY